MISTQELMVTTGFPSLDKVIGGWGRGDFVVLGGRPSSGKSALSLAFVLAAAKSGVPGLIITMETQAKELASRTLAITTQVPLNQITGSVPLPEHWATRLASGSPLTDLPIWIDDHADQTPTSIAAVSRGAVHQHQIGLIVIDYLQLVRHEGRIPDQQYHTRLSNTSRSLKRLAKSLNVPVICLAPIHHACEARAEGRPTLADFHESGTLEQDADIALLLWPQKADPVCPSQVQEIRVIVAKQRNGSHAVVPLNFTPQFTRFEDRVPTI